MVLRGFSKRISTQFVDLSTCFLGHFQVGSYRYRSLIEGLYTTMESILAPSLAERAKNKAKALQDEVARLGNELADAKDRLTRHEAAQQSEAPAFYRHGIRFRLRVFARVADG